MHVIEGIAGRRSCQTSVQVLSIRELETAGTLRIGELSRRSGVSPELLRAWERRYGLLQPTRSPGGLRLYSPDDLARVEAMRRHLADGFAAAEAAALTTRTSGRNDGVIAFPAAKDELAAALASFDDGDAHGDPVDEAEQLTRRLRSEPHRSPARSH